MKCLDDPLWCGFCNLIPPLDRRSSVHTFIEKICRIPFIEVHLSAVAAREPFRQISYFSDIAMGVISGFHGESYMLATQAIINLTEL